MVAIGVYNGKTSPHLHIVIHHCPNHLVTKALTSDCLEADELQIYIGAFVLMYFV
jgi:hypothetical protein